MANRKALQWKEKLSYTKIFETWLLSTDESFYPTIQLTCCTKEPLLIQPITQETHPLTKKISSNESYLVSDHPTLVSNTVTNPLW